MTASTAPTPSYSGRQIDDSSVPPYSRQAHNSRMSTDFGGSGSRMGGYSDDPLQPADPYKLWTPREALLSKFGLFNIATAVILSFVINVGTMYGSVGQKDMAGVWYTPQTANPYSLQLWSDYLLVACATWAGLGLLAVPGFWAMMKFPAIPLAVKMTGAPNPIDSEYVSGAKAHWLTKLSLAAYMPTGWKHFLTRTLLLTFIYTLVYYGITLLIVFGMGKSGGVFAAGSVYPNDWIKPVPYIWIKTAWATVFSAIIFPVGIVSGLSMNNLPQSSIDGWMQKRQQHGANGSLFNQTGKGYDGV